MQSAKTREGRIVMGNSQVSRRSYRSSFNPKIITGVGSLVDDLPNDIQRSNDRSDGARSLEIRQSGKDMLM